MKHSWKWNSSPSTLFISSHFNIPHSTFSNRQNCNFIIAKRSSSSYNKKFTSFSGKNPHFCLTLPYLYQWENLSAPQPFPFIVLSLCECSWFIKRYIPDKDFIKNGKREKEMGDFSQRNLWTTCCKRNYFVLQ